MSSFDFLDTMRAIAICDLRQKGGTCVGSQEARKPPRVFQHDSPFIRDTEHITRHNTFTTKYLKPIHTVGIIENHWHPIQTTEKLQRRFPRDAMQQGGGV